MKGWKWDVLPKEIEVKVHPLKRELPSQVLEEVEAIWQETKKEKGDLLFNAPFFSVTSFSLNKIEGEFVEYKWYNAQKKNKALSKELKVHPLGVCGVLSYKNKFLLGKRASFVTDNPLYFEFAPSGGMDNFSLLDTNLHFLEQFYKELQEETGLSFIHLEENKEFFLIQDNEENSYDILVKANIKEPIPELHAEENEYTSFIFASKEELMDGKYTPLTPFVSYLLNNVLIS